MRPLFLLERYSMNVRVVKSQIENSFAVVEFLATEARDMRLTEIAHRLGLPRSGAHRLLTALRGLGWVEQDLGTEQYRLSLKLSALGQRFLVSTRILDVCQPVLDRVAEESRELVRLAVIEGGELTTIAHAQGAQGTLVVQSRIFPTLPLHVTASGKAWLAMLPDETALRIVLAAGFGEPGAFGPNALRSVDALQRELALTRQRGYGLAVEEAEPGVTGVAVTICPAQGIAQGVLAIVGPALRMTPERIVQVAAIASKAADELAMLWPLRLVVPDAIPHPRAVA
jgi:DNA-binding IclR family transcriptional regulator